MSDFIILHDDSTEDRAVLRKNNIRALYECDMPTGGKTQVIHDEYSSEGEIYVMETVEEILAMMERGNQ